MSTNDSARKPAIVSPVSRSIGVTDTTRSLAFYRDILGFDAPDVTEGSDRSTSIEIVSGPARIELRRHSAAPDDPSRQRPLGSCILFFQADDVTAARDAIIARGGQPSELEKVNWIKMKVFEIRDPDGHTLWFGQSYDGPDQPNPKGQLQTIMPNFPLDDVPAGIAYYRDVLGFKVNYAQSDFGVMDRDEVRLLLIARTEKHKGIGSCYVYVEDADTLHAELQAKGANVQGEPVSHPWGLRDFRVLDPERNQLCFGQPFE